MYLSRSRTGNIFPSWTVVVRRHHVYVPEFHCPSCNSVVAPPPDPNPPPQTWSVSLEVWGWEMKTVCVFGGGG